MAPTHIPQEAMLLLICSRHVKLITKQPVDVVIRHAMVVLYAWPVGCARQCRSAEQANSPHGTALTSRCNEQAQCTMSRCQICHLVSDTLIACVRSGSSLRCPDTLVSTFKHKEHHQAGSHKGYRLLVAACNLQVARLQLCTPLQTCTQLRR
jgi:hypothetical protein